MPTRAIYRATANTPKLKPASNAAPIYVDSTNGNALKVNVGGPGSSTELTVPTVVGAVVNKVAGGTGILDALNPTPIVTGLTTVSAFVAIPLATTVGAGVLALTHGTPVGGTVDVYAWDAAGVASTATNSFSWIAVGT